MAIGANSRLVFDYVKEHDGEDFIAADMVEPLGLGIKVINGAITAWQKKKIMMREEVEVQVETPDGFKTQTLKFIRLTDAGREFDIDAIETDAKK